MARRGRGGTSATTALARAGVTFHEHTYEHDRTLGAFGLEAAEALEVDPSRVFKTLVVAAPGGLLAVAIVPVERQLDLKAVAAALGVKRVAMAEPAVAERATGYVRGGISPLGQKRALPTLLDASAGDHGTIYVSGGRRGLDVELAPDILLQVTGGRMASIAVT